MSEMDDPRLDEDARMDTLSTQDSSGAYDDFDQYYKEPTEIAATVRELQVALAAERARAEAAERELSDERGHKDVIYAAFKAAEARLAAVPVEEIRRCFAPYHEDENRWADDTNAVLTWLARQEAQP